MHDVPDDAGVEQSPATALVGRTALRALTAQSFGLQVPVMAEKSPKLQVVSKSPLAVYPDRHAVVQVLPEETGTLQSPAAAPLGNLAVKASASQGLWPHVPLIAEKDPAVHVVSKEPLAV